MAQSVWDAAHLAEVKASLDRPYYAEAYRRLIERADAMLDAGPLSVMDKAQAPASGDKHDYMSLARYMWPDPSKPSGLPYITRDGVTNPEIDLYDRNRLGETADRIATLALAWYLTGDEKYAAKATELIRVWFLDKKTAMNPNLEYAQVARGHNGDKGRSYGLIDTYSFIEMLDGVQLLESSKSFTKADARKLRRWFSDFSKWMRESGQGRAEAAAENNHSIAYDAQLIAFSLFAGDRPVAEEVILALPEKRIFAQVEPDGSQPAELKRTLAYHYSNYNIEHLIDILLMARHAGIGDAANAESADGRSFVKATDFLARFTGPDAEAWPYAQISGAKATEQSAAKSLYRTANYILADTDTARRARYNDIYAATRVLNHADPFNILYYTPDLADDAMTFAAGQLAIQAADAAKALREPENAARRRVQPRTVGADGELVMIHPHDWCSGFFPGSLWQLYSYTNRPADRETAISWTWPIEESKWHSGTHDLGFMMNNSFGKGWDLTGEQSYRDVVLRSARTLISRYSPTVHSIRSWDHNRDKWDFPVIIDNMMNLEMLFRATQLTGDSIFWNVAVDHANTTMRNHFRPDYSSYHVVDYNPSTGEVQTKCTAQGYADDSFWSRGQAWGLYGFTVCYRFTHDPAYLKQAEGIADFILSLPNMPADLVPYWDMKAPGTLDRTPDNVNADVPRDASAAAIAASGLYELARYTDPARSRRYTEAADRMVESLTRDYQAEPGAAHGFLLLHSTGHLPANSEIDVPLNYADYYYLEALLRGRKH